MKLIDANKLANDEYLEKRYGTDFYWEFRKRIDMQPIVCDTEQIRAEIKHLLNRPSSNHVIGYDKGFVDGIDKVLQIIDRRIIDSSQTETKAK